MTGPRCLPRPIPCPPPPPRTPPPPPPPAPQQTPPRSQAPPVCPVPPLSTSARDVWIPVSDGTYISDNGSTCMVRTGRSFSGRVKVTYSSGAPPVVKEGNEEMEPHVTIKEEPALPPFTTLLKKEPRIPTPKPPLPVQRWTPTPPPPPPAQNPAQRWVSPQRPMPPQRPLPPYQGIVVREASVDPPPPYGEVLVENQQPIGVRGN